MVGQLYHRNAVLFRDRTAYVHGPSRVTHGELYDRVRILASALYRNGARHQHRIGIISPNCLAYYELYGACEQAGYIIANYSFRSAAPELVHMMSDSAPTILLFGEDQIDIVDAARVSVDGVLQYVCIGSNPPAWAMSYDDLMAQGDLTPLPFGPAPQDFVHLFYTSGTTGKPKGVPIRQSAAIMTSQVTAVEEDMNVLQMTPAFHVGGRGQGLGAFWNGGKVVIESAFDANRFLETIEREQINVTFMVPPMIRAVLDCPDFASYDLSSLKWVMAASTKIPADLLARARAQIGPAFYTAYGSTEGGAITRMKRSDFQSDGSEESLKRLESVGSFEPFVDGRILDDDGNQLAIGEVGEICIRTYWWSGYWNNNVATIAAQHGDYLRTGDLGYVDSQGFVFLVDRKKDMIISGGENIYSREVEDALQYHPAVHEVAVIGQPDPKWGETVCAIVVLHTGASATDEELIAFARTRIARFKCPRRIVFLPRMVLNGTGKIDKALLRRTYGTPPAGPEDDQPLGRHPIEEASGAIR